MNILMFHSLHCSYSQEVKKKKKKEKKKKKKNKS